MQTVAMLLLVPADPLLPRQADGHFAPEATAAADLGIQVALVDHDALTEPGGARRAVARVPGEDGDAVYRGWMLTPRRPDGSPASAHPHRICPHHDSHAEDQGFHNQNRCTSFEPSNAMLAGQSLTLQARSYKFPIHLRRRCNSHTSTDPC